MANENVSLSLSVEGRRDVERELGRVDRALEQVGRGLREVDGDADAADRAFRELGRDADRNMRSLSSDVGRATSDIGRDLRGVGRDTDKLSRDLRSLANDSDRAARQMQGAFDDVEMPQAGAAGGAAGSAADKGKAGVLGFVAGAIAATGIPELTERAFSPISLQGDYRRAATILNTESQQLLALKEELQSLRGIGDDEALEGIVAIGQSLSELLGEGETIPAIDQLLALSRTPLGGAQEIADTMAQLGGVFEEDDVLGMMDAFAALARTQGVTAEVTEVAHEYSGAAAALGLSLEEYLGALAAAADPQSRLHSVDKVGDALLEFQIRLADEGITEVDDALASLGFNAERTRRALADGGEEGAEAFGEIVSRLREIDDNYRQQNLVRSLFGSPGEDLAQIQPLLDVLDITETRLNTTSDAAERLADSMSNDWMSNTFAALARARDGGWFPSAGSLGPDPFGVTGATGSGSRRRAGAGPVAFGNGFVGPIADRLENNVNVQVDVNVRGGVIDNTGTQRALASALAPHITREVDRQVRRSSVFGGRTEGTR